ncbi:MAG: endo alpha-1,4 polygalactosaminidase [Hyphomicrobiaceae bacterium]|nr:endo alpha-1,4 polygalactosaminidase [Hyphomicrobiaceae bacterium]
MPAAVRSALALVMCLLAGLGSAVGQTAIRAADDLGQLLLQSSNWTYQLQGVRPAELAVTRFDVIVMDAFFGGGRREIERLRTLPFGRRRLLLSYLSIGEAEVYRYYWQRCCSGGKRPPWITTENQRWRGNWRVHFWDPEWKSIIFQEDDSYLKRIIAAGFDGVYLDRIDVHSEVSAPGIAPRAEMLRFVRELSATAKAMRPGFLVIAQNAEELADDASYLAAIDGIAKEDLLYGVAGEGKRNEPGMIKESTALLMRAHAAGKHIMVVEYLSEPATIERARTEILELGFVPYFAPRSLGKLQVESLELDDSH